MRGSRRLALAAAISTRRPRSVTIGTTLWSLGAFTNLAGALVTAAGFFAAASGYIAVGVLVLLWVAVQFAATIAMATGRNWARILLTVIAVLQAASAGTSLANGSTAPTFSWVSTPLVLVGTGLLYTRAASGFFRPARADRSAR